MPTQPSTEPEAAPIAASPSLGAQCPRPPCSTAPLPHSPTARGATAWLSPVAGGARSPSPSGALPAGGAELAARARSHPGAPH